MHSAIRPFVMLGVAMILAACGTASSPTGTASSPSTEPSISAPTATPHPRLGDQDPLDAGRYRVSAEPTIDVTVAVPSGWSSSGDWVVMGPRGNEEPDGMAIRFYSGELNLLVNPLSLADGELDPPIGPTVDDLVRAIVAHPAWTATAPTDITIDGHPGHLVQLTIPMDAPLTGEEKFYLFVDQDGGQVWGWAPGQTFDLYIVDVDGQRLVIDAFHYPGTPEADLAAQREVVGSVQVGSTP